MSDLKKLSNSIYDLEDSLQKIKEDLEEKKLKLQTIEKAAEKQKESLSFASDGLTGFPVGLNWKEYLKSSGKKFHPIYVHVVSHERLNMKIKDVHECMNCHAQEEEKPLAKDLKISNGLK